LLFDKEGSDIQIKPHADSPAVFVLEFGVKEKTTFFVEGENVFIMFYIGVNGKKTDGTIVVAASTGYTVGRPYHKGTDTPVILPERVGNGKFGDFHGRDSLKRVMQIMEFFFRKRQFNGIRNKGHICGNVPRVLLAEKPCKGDIILPGTECVAYQVIVVLGNGTAKTVKYAIGVQLFKSKLGYFVVEFHPHGLLLHDSIDKFVNFPVILDSLGRYRSTNLFDDFPGDFFILYFRCLYGLYSYSHYCLRLQYTKKTGKKQEISTGD
jgi:hypothetical protein